MLADANFSQPSQVKALPQKSVKISPLTQRATSHVIKVSSEFVEFLNNPEKSETQALVARLNQFQHNQQQTLEHSQQQDLQLRENTRIVTQRLNLAFSEHFTYPRLAQRNGWQGMVKLGLRIEPNGELSQIRVVSTSGFPVLDQDALETLNRISRLHGVENWLSGQHIDAVLPVEYKLLGG